MTKAHVAYQPHPKNSPPDPGEELLGQALVDVLVTCGVFGP